MDREEYDVSIQPMNKERRYTEYGVLWNPGEEDELWSDYGPEKQTAARVLKAHKEDYPNAICMHREVIYTKWSHTTPHDVD